MREEYAAGKLQFRVLYRVFLLRVVDLELLSAGGDTTKLLGQFAALLAAVSFLFTAPVILIGIKLPHVAILTMEHLLIATTMLVVGLFSVLNWDSVFPDRRDVLVLAPLPVRASTLFRAKLTALAFALCLSVLALNVFSGLVWPLLYFPMQGGFLEAIRSLAAYWMTIFVAGAFIFCFVLGVQGVAAQLLPRQQFLRLSALLQVAAFCLFLGVYILEPSLEAPRLLAAPENQQLLAWSPTYWFLGLFQQLNGSMSPAFIPLARRAWIGLAIAVFGAGTVLLLSYFRTLRKIVEEPDILPDSRRLKWPQRFGSSLESAVLLFSGRTLLRSRQHRVILSFYLGVGFAIVLAYLNFPFGKHDLARAATPFLAASILMMCITVAGMRVVFSMPIALRANWIFRLTELRKAPKYSAAIRRSLFVLGVIPVWLASGALLSCILPFRLVIEHLLVLGLLGAILVELCIHGFQKIPFTCSYLPGKGNIQYVFWAASLLLLPLVNSGAQFERRMLGSPFDYVSMILILGIVAACARWRTAAIAKSAAGLQFDEVNPPEVFALQLHQE